MQRHRALFLENWLESTDRKPLVIRGARQVGKTWLVRYLAKSKKKKLIEINFEKRPELSSLFTSNDPKEIILNLNGAFNEMIDPKNCLLFLDEIQAAPELLAKLRWFHEDLPELPCIAAGSLLEFVLADHTFSMPVGRISYLHLEPLTFEEFLLACQQQGLYEYLRTYQMGKEIPEAIHQSLMTAFKEYIIVGGMPAAVSSWVEKRSLQSVNQIHHELIATYRDDFAKYRGRIPLERLEEILHAVPRHLSHKFMYSKVNPLVQIPSIKSSLELLCKARLCHRVLGCAANGIPLEAELQAKFLKVIFLDVGLCAASLGLTLDEVQKIDEIDLINSGGVAEQVAGQGLRTIFPSYVEPSLYYWHREEQGSSSEIDYVFQHHNHVIPIEVKSGARGSLKSLHIFMGLKGGKWAVRINSAMPQIQSIEVVDSLGSEVNYQLLSIPFYLIGQLHRLLDEVGV